MASLYVSLSSCSVEKKMAAVTAFYVKVRKL